MNPEFEELRKKAEAKQNEILEFICGICGKPDEAGSCEVCDSCPVELLLQAYTRMVKELGQYEALSKLKKKLSESLERSASGI